MFVAGIYLSTLVCHGYRLQTCRYDGFNLFTICNELIVLINMKFIVNRLCKYSANAGYFDKIFHFAMDTGYKHAGMTALIYSRYAMG